MVSRMIIASSVRPLSQSVSRRDLGRPMAESLQCKHGDPSHHPVDNKTGRAKEAAERCAECKIQ